MRTGLLTLAALLWAVRFGQAGQVDLRKIDHTIRKEPAYQTKSPKYCLLVFGPEVHSKAWLVLDGDTLYVDRNCNGDLTEAGKRVAMPRFEKPEAPLFAAQREVKAGDIRDGRFTHTNLEVTELRLNPDYKPKDTDEEMALRLARSSPGGLLYEISLSVERRSGQGRVQFTAFVDTQGFLQFAESPMTAPVIHFDGPLKMGLQPFSTLAREGKPTDLHCYVGTPGRGNGTFATLVYLTNPLLIPENCHPLAEVRFPAKEQLTAKVVLDHRC